MAQNTEGSTRWLHGSVTLVHDGKKYYNALTGKPVDLTEPQIAALTRAPKTFTATPARQAKPPARRIRGPGAHLGSGATA